MVFSTEVKNFTKNTLILTLFFALVLDLSWGYVGPMFGLNTNAGANDLRYQQVGVNYLGNTATAMSLSVGQKEIKGNTTPVELANSTISIAEVLSNPTVGQQKLIGNNMLAISNYANILTTNMTDLLDRATDRTVALNEHILLLKNYYNKTQERLTVINEQIADLNNIISTASTATNNAKTTMQNSYVGFDYSGVDGAIDTYISAKNQDTRARVYLSYLEKFRKSYQILQTNNGKLIDTLSQNREALIKRATIIIPDSGTDIIKQLKLIQSEADAKAQKINQ